ncbi:MAG: Serine protease, subtilase family [Candidatus Saccharibacteria bacterium]|nr:Serine protease, subtilase family [Candidatus Saccharibacteria bacterium]
MTYRQVHKSFLTGSLLLLLVTGFGLIMTFSGPGKKITNRGASADSATASNPLPFDQASSATYQASSKKVFAHYMESYPLSLSNTGVSTNDYYDSHFVPPGTIENFPGAKNYPLVGGMWRERPIKRPAYAAGVDWQTEDAKIEIKNAMSAGIDGFAVDIMTLNASDQKTGTLKSLMKAATQLNNGFKIMLVPDGTILGSASTDATAMGNLFADLASSSDGGALYRVNNKLVLAPFYPEADGKTPTYWSGVISQLSARGIGTYFVPTFLTLNTTNADDYASISEGMGRWGDASASANTDASMNNYANIVKSRKGVGGQSLFYLQPVRAQDTRPRGGSGGSTIADGTYWEADNSENLRDTWRGADNNAQWVELMTWNDYAETSEIAPSTHNGYNLLDINAYYIHQFKLGSNPVIKRDALYISNRDEMAGAYPPTKPAVTDKTEVYFMKLNSGGPARNKVEVMSFLAAPQQISVTIGGAVQTYNAPAGQFVQLYDAKIGAVSASINYSNGTKRVVNGTTITTTPFVQDFMYQYAGSARQGTTVGSPTTTPTCPTGQTGTPPNCVTPVKTCPTGQTGTPPNCVTPVTSCPTGQTGTPPNCVTPVTGGKVDLIVTNLTWSPASPLTGNAITFTATVKNQGTAATPAGTIVGVSFLVDGKQVSWSDTQTASIPAGGSVTLSADNGPTKSATWSTTTAGNKTVAAYVDDINRIKNESDENNNTLTKVMTVNTPAPKPDLIVSDLTWSPASPKAGDNVTFSATIKNQGNGATPAGTIHGVSFSVDGKQVSWSDNYTSSIPAGGSASVTADFGPNKLATWPATAGTKTVLAYVDDINRIKNESDENNNTLTKSLTVTATTPPTTTGPDLVITDFSWSPLSPKTGEGVIFNATVKNQGTAATPAGTILGVSFSIDGKQVSWSDSHTTALAAGASVKLTANSGPTGSGIWAATAAGTKTALAYVDDIDRIKGELNESNNTATKTLTVVTVSNPTGPGNPGTPPGSNLPPVVVTTGGKVTVPLTGGTNTPIQVSGGGKVVVPTRSSTGAPLKVTIDGETVDTDSSDPSNSNDDNSTVTIDTSKLINGDHTVTVTDPTTGETTTQTIVVRNNFLRDAANRVRTHAVTTGATTVSIALAGLAILHFHLIALVRRRFFHEAVGVPGNDFDLKPLDPHSHLPGDVITPHDDRSDHK